MSITTVSEDKTKKIEKVTLHISTLDLHKTQDNQSLNTQPLFGTVCKENKSKIKKTNHSEKHHDVVDMKSRKLTWLGRMRRRSENRMMKMECKEN